MAGEQASDAPLAWRVGRRLRAFADRRRSGPWTSEALSLTAVVATLVVLGLVMSFSASFVDAAETGDPFGIFRRQLLWAGVGVPLFLATASVDHRLWRPLSWVLLVLSLAGLVAVLIPGIGLLEGGSRRWIAIGPLVVQPSEIAKLGTLLWLSDVFARKRERGLQIEDDLGHLLVPALPVLGLEAGLVILEPDLGTALLLTMIVLLLLWVEGIAFRVLATVAAVGGVLGAAAAVLEPYRFARLTGWWNPEADPLGNGYQLLQSLYALGSGGWFGVGLGSSRSKWNFVPNPETDFIYAIIGEELGLLGALFVLLLFVAILVVGLRVARQAPDHFGRLVAFGVTGWIVGQALVNIGAVTGLMPITGVTLPLVSVGGSSLVSTLVALGILVSVARAGAEGDPA